MTVLNASNPRQDYIRDQERRRYLASLGVSVALYALALLVLWIAGWGRQIEYSEYAGPILIRVGLPEAPDVPSPATPPAAESVPQAVRPPEPTPVPAANLPPVPPPAQTAKTPSAKVPETPPPSPTPLVPSTEGAQAGPIKGEEFGNSHETTFEATEGRVGRTLYVPIWTFMPLPRTVEDRVYNAIPGDGFRSAVEQKKRFQEFYEFGSGGWQLKRDVPLGYRQSLWLMLEGSAQVGSGFDLGRADYKSGRSLAPVQIRFIVGPAQGNLPPELKSAEIVQSSGYPEIDEAVLYGFRRASFSNNSDKTVTGRFSYRF